MKRERERLFEERERERYTCPSTADMRERQCVRERETVCVGERDSVCVRERQCV